MDITKMLQDMSQTLQSQMQSQLEEKEQVLKKDYQAKEEKLKKEFAEKEKEFEEQKKAFEKEKKEEHKKLEDAKRNLQKEWEWISKATGNKSRVEEEDNSTTKEKEKEKGKEKGKIPKSGYVRVNIGGTIYHTTIETLRSNEDSMISAMFSGRHPVVRDDTGAFFIDRDGSVFGYVLETLRNNRIDMNEIPNNLRAKVLREFDYYSIIPPSKLSQSLFSLYVFDTYFDNWLPENDSITLLYRGSRDGMNVSTFHSLCDNKGATLTVVKSTNGYLFGGYNNQSWTSSGSYSSSSTTFLFTLTNPHDVVPTKYVVTKASNAANNNSSYGPTFGGGHDLHVNFSSGSSYTNFPSSYQDTTGKGNNTFTGARNFDVQDIEVWKIDVIWKNNLLDSTQQATLEKWFPNKIILQTLLYSGSRDGMSPTTFHSLCDNKGATLTVVKSTNGYLFGGYNDQSWTSSGSYSSSSATFLFTLTNPHGIAPTKYPISSTSNTTYNNASYGPTFGGGHDLHVSFSSGSSYIGFPNTYQDTTGKGNSTFTGAYNYDVQDIQVWKVE